MNNDLKDTNQETPEMERKRRKKEYILIVILFAAVALGTSLVTHTSCFTADLTSSGTLSMFILFNLNMMLFLFLVILVLRNLAKLYYDRKHKIMGSRLRTKLLVAFISLTILPTTVLFYFSIQFISTSLDFWFNSPVEQALEKSMTIGRQLYTYIEENSQFNLKRMASQINDKKFLTSDSYSELNAFVHSNRMDFNLSAVEVYDLKAHRIAFSAGKTVEKIVSRPIPADEFQKEERPDTVRTFSETATEGDIVRFISTIPYGNNSDPKGYIAITALIPSDMSKSLTSISKGYEEYKQRKLLRNPIQVSFIITLSIVVLLVLFCAVWFAFYLARSMTIPLMKLAEGTRRVAEGDLSVNISITAGDEIGILVDSFNKMTHDLGISREQLGLSARMLREQNLEIEEKRQYMEIVLQNISAGVISLDSWGAILTINKAAERMLGIKSEQIIRKSYKELLNNTQLGKADEIAEKLESSSTGGVDFPITLTVENRVRSFMVHSNALKDDNGNSIGLVIVFDDLTELEKAQRIAAWREVARRIAHEVKNPLTPIALSAERLKRRYSSQVQDPVFDECTRTIIDHVDLIRNLVNAFSNFARFPMSNPAPCDLTVIIEESVSLYRESHLNVAFTIRTNTEIPSLNIDRQQIKQAMINLLDNAIAALHEKGDIIITMEHHKNKGIVTLEVADNGPGIPDNVKARMFEPYFSTKKSGTGLGLAIVNSIISDHNGSIRVFDNKPRGTRFVIEFPV